VEIAGVGPAPTFGEMRGLDDLRASPGHCAYEPGMGKTDNFL
jgi:hypothetical protein